MSHVLAIDCGTTNLKAGVISPSGELLSHSRRSLALHTPEENAAEHDADELFEALVDAAREAVKGYGPDISVLGLSGYQFGFIPLDSDGQALTGMITLLDGRSRAAVSELSELMPVEELYAKSGLPPMFTSLLAKILWLRKDRPAVFDRTACFADIKSFFIHRLTGQLITEPSIAATTQLLNMAEMTWDPDLMSAAGIAEDRLPEVRSGDRLLGPLSDEMTGKLGLSGEVQLLPGLYDGGAMMVGMGGLSGREGVCSLGTTTMLRVCVNRPVLDDPATRRLQTYPLFSGTWATGGGINNAGVVLQWLKDNLLGGRSYDEVLGEAAEIAPGSQELFCLPYLSGERDPRISENASGLFLGIRQNHRAGHFCRAVLEGVAYTVNLIKKAASSNGIELDDIRICGSGSQSDLWCQIFADVTGVPVQRPAEEDATLTGTAMLAGVANGIFQNLDEASEAMLRTGRTFCPQPEARRKYSRAFRCFEKILTGAKKMYGTHAAYCEEE